MNVLFCYKKYTLLPMAVSGHNGNNETFIGVSNSMGLTLYDENSNETPIRKTSEPINIVLPRTR